MAAVAVQLVFIHIAAVKVGAGGHESSPLALQFLMGYRRFLPGNLSRFHTHGVSPC